MSILLHHVIDNIYSTSLEQAQEIQSRIKNPADTCHPSFASIKSWLTCPLVIVENPIGNRIWKGDYLYLKEVGAATPTPINIEFQATKGSYPYTIGCKVVFNELSNVLLKMRREKTEAEGDTLRLQEKLERERNKVSELELQLKELRQRNKAVEEELEEYKPDFMMEDIPIYLADEADEMEGVRPELTGKFVGKASKYLARKSTYKPSSKDAVRGIYCHESKRVAWILRSGICVVDDFGPSLAVHICTSEKLATDIVTKAITVREAKKSVFHIKRIPHSEGYELQLQQNLKEIA